MRVLTLATTTALLSGCALFAHVPADDPSTPNINEKEIAEAAIAQAELELKTESEHLGLLLPPPLNWLIPSAAGILLIVAASVRQARAEATATATTKPPGT